jgi:ubiquinone/menaquinone biosynthesis C-methylase UbiE
MEKSKSEKYIPALSFDFLTPIYDPVVALTTREKRFRPKLIEQMGLNGSQRLLDVGCGTATLTIALKNSCKSAEVYGLDGDPKILYIARRKAEKAGAAVTFDKGLSYELPYPDGSFDIIASSLFFHHLTPENKLLTLKEIFRVLKPGGQLHVADWGRASNLLMRIVSLPVQWLDGATTKDSFQGKLPEIVREAGFEEIAETGSIDTLFGTIRLLKAIKI